jgi:hypothetical protein
MARPYKLTIPKTKAELYDLLGWMVLECPDFHLDWPGRDINTSFEELNQGLLNVLRPGPSLEVCKAWRVDCGNSATLATNDLPFMF